MADQQQGQAPTDMTDTFKQVLDILQEAPNVPTGGGQVDIDEVIERLEGALERLNQQMEDVYKRTGMTQDELEEYAANPENFSEDEWSLLTQIRGELGRYREQAEEALSSVAPTEAEKTPSKPKRRRRKSWLQS